MSPGARSFLFTIRVVTFLTAAWQVAAQGTGILDGTTPVGVAPGSPADSYALSGFDTINFFSGT